MNFKEWIIAESVLSRAEELYLNFIDGDIEFSKLGPAAVRAIEKWYEKHQLGFDYDEFKSKVLKRIKKAEEDSIEDVLSLVSSQLERNRIRGGIKLSDEEGFKPERPKEKPEPVIAPKPVEIPKQPIEIPKPIVVPRVEPVIASPVEMPKPIGPQFLRFHKPWQKKLDLWPDKPTPTPQRKLF